MKDKYVEERFPRWMEFGTSADGTKIDIVDPEGDLFHSVPREMAEEIMRARNAFVDELIRIFESDPEVLFRFKRTRL